MPAIGKPAVELPRGKQRVSKTNKENLHFGTTLYPRSAFAGGEH